MTGRNLAFVGLAAILQAQAPAPAPTPGPPALEPAAPALTAKAPGQPGYGLVLTSPIGKVLFTSLAFDASTLSPSARFYLIWGPAGWGPYRSGLEGHLMHSPKGYGQGLHAVWYESHFMAYGTSKDSPAARSGLDVASPFFAIDRVDGQNFGWDPRGLTYHITQRPSIVVEAIKLPVFFGPSHTTRTVINQRVDSPPGPAEAELQPLASQEPLLKPLLADRSLWRALLEARSRVPRLSPLPIQIDGQARWAVITQGPLGPEQPPTAPQVLEIWKQDPRLGAFDAGLESVVAGPPEGPRQGQLLRMGSRWYRLERFARDPETQAMTALEVRPFSPDIQALLAGELAAPRLSGLELPQRESLEGVANDALLEWKTLTLPTELAQLDLTACGRMVIRLEKGVLALDLEVKGIRSRLDAAARHEAELKAQAQIAPQEGKPVATPVPPAAVESERLADLLDQRKAILMAVLGSAKQALASLRR